MDLPLHSIQAGFGAYPANTGAYFSMDKVAGSMKLTISFHPVPWLIKNREDSAFILAVSAVYYIILR
jgi:hypothetical protein